MDGVRELLSESLGLDLGAVGAEELCWLQGSAKCLHCILGSKGSAVFGLHAAPD